MEWGSTTLAFSGLGAAALATSLVKLKQRLEFLWYTTLVKKCLGEVCANGGKLAHLGKVDIGCERLAQLFGFGCTGARPFASDTWIGRASRWCRNDDVRCWL